MMKRILVILLLFAAVKAFSQSQDIIGSWLSADKVHKTQYFIKSNGIVEKRTALGSEDVWSKNPQKGTYTFKEGRLVLIWENSSSETIHVEFKEGNATFRLIDKQGKVGKAELFLKIVEEVVPDN